MHMSHLFVGTALPLKCIFLLDLIGPLRTMHALSVGEGVSIRKIRIVFVLGLF